MPHLSAARFRVTLPRAERLHPWLSYLFDCYALIDASVAEAIDDAARAGRHPACAKGCGACCHQPIPVTPLEAAGLRWYAREAMEPRVLAALRGRPDNTGRGGGLRCRFLLGGICAVYPVRPVACRRYVVLGTPCSPDEDPASGRPHDMLVSSREAMNAAFAAALPYYAVLGESVPAPGDVFAFMAARTVVLHTVSAGILGVSSEEPHLP